MRKKPEILDTRTVASSRLFRIEAVNLRFPNGVEVEYERLRGAGKVGAVIIVPMLDENTVLLIREYGVGLERYELGLPKGRVEPDEDMLEAANRELMEEAGYGARTLTPLQALSLAPAYMGHRTQIVLAEGLYPQREEGDEPEPIEVVPTPLNELDDLIFNGDELTEGRSIAALYLARSWLERRPD
ncbi:ADP-ribose diphosphatase [Natronocella acetinitrilica]|uniref:ADP-ribose diphosphatase n=1 Tax=Natronocella acetinitrilica TaxID=414046 RepID=A0AAE3G0V6_9GAMM|nr:ADP compounds hydrolase NudE [Natronocella acetinitrilica]MCP1673043.1 ADP-ribose diphosphatase [Natronocella acetinitrilica]